MGKQVRRDDYVIAGELDRPVGVALRVRNPHTKHERDQISEPDELVVGREFSHREPAFGDHVIACRFQVGEERLPPFLHAKSIVDNHGMLGDERRRPWIWLEALNRTRPDSLADRCRHVDEVGQLTGGRIQDRGGIFLGPAVVVLRDGHQDVVTPRAGRQGFRVPDDHRRQSGMVRLSDEMLGIASGTDDHDTIVA